MTTVNPKVNIALVALMGLPASGKTVLTCKIAENYAGSHVYVIPLSYDDFVSHEIQRRFPDVQGSAKALRKCFILCVQTLIVQLRKSSLDLDVTELRGFIQAELAGMTNPPLFVDKLSQVVSNVKGDKSNFIIIIDDNNYYKSMRWEWYQMAKMNSTGFAILHCKASVETCLERNAKRSEETRVPPEVIEDMERRKEILHPLKSASDIYCINLPEAHPDSEEFNFPMVVRCLDHILMNPVELPPDRSEEIERERRICSENEVHQADQILRKWINSEMTLASFSSGASGKKALGKELSRKKTVVLDKLRSGEFTLLAQVHEDLGFKKEVIALAKSLELTKLVE